MNISIPELLQKRWVIPTIVGVFSFAGGLGGGYILGKRSVMYEDAVIDEPQMSLFDPDGRVSGELVTNTTHSMKYEKLELIDPIIEDDGDFEYGEPSEPTKKNIFPNEFNDWDYEVEISSRKHTVPYIIHYDEFVGNEKEYNQETLTYFAGDDIISDQSDTPIYNYEGLMGELKFGHGSGDPSVVYIRNEEIRMEWEILLSMGRFEVEVLGHTIEEEYEAQDLKHSMHHKFRMD